MKLICRDEHRLFLEERLKAYEEMDIVLVENGEYYEGLSYNFDMNHLDSLLKYLENKKKHKTIVGYIDERMYPVMIDDIVYIEGYSKDCYFYTMDQEYLSDYKLYEIEEMLQGTSFIRISKSMLVNICFIQYMKAEVNMKYGLYMKSNVKLTLSRKYVNDFKRKIGKR